MKKIFTQFFLFVALLAASTNLSAQTYNGGTWYSLYDETEHSAYTTTGVNNNITICSHTAFVPSTGVLTFNTRMTKFVATNPGDYQILVAGQTVDVASKQTSYTTKSTTIDALLTSLEFKLKYNSYNSARNVFIDDVKLPLAQHILLANNTTKDSKSFGNVAIDGASAGQTISLRSFLTNGNITVKSSDNAFRINSANNLSGLTYAVGANACASANGQSGAQAGDATLGDINQYAFDIYFCPTEAKEYSATITITDGTSTATISVSGVGVKKTQQLTWAADFQADVVSLPVGEEIVNPATTNSGLALTYTSSDETVLAVEGTTIKALQAGEVTLTVEQAGDDNWNAVSATKTIKVTEKTIQFIHWIDNLTRLVVGGEPVQLTATAQILLDAETDEIQDAPERTALITYTSANDAVVTIDGTTLIIVGEGETTLTASLPGDDIYEATSISMPVRVRVPSTTCEAYVLDAPEEVSYEAPSAGSYEPAALTGPAHILTFQARSQYSTRVGPIIFEQYVNGQWKKLDEGNPSTDWRDYRYELDRNATKVRFRNEVGSFKRYFKNVLVSQATYLETTTPAITIEKSIIGDNITQTIAVQYSNLPEGVMITNTSDIIQLSDNELGTECGTYGEKLITLTATPTAVGTVEDVVTIKDEATGLTLNIPVTIHTQRNTQTILWEDSIETIYATDDITLTATAQTPIHYTSSDSAIAYVDAANQLLVQSLGTVTITAHAVESDTYEAAELSKEITIVATPPVVTALPTVEPLGYGVELTNDLLVGGEANVDGVFVWNLGDEQPELIPGEHNLPIQFVPNNKELYASLDTTVLVTVLKGQQTITWNDDLSHVTVGDTIILTASANTEVIYESSDMEIVEIEDNRAIFLKAGAVTIYAQALEDEYYLSTTLAKDATVYPAEIGELVTQYPTATEITYGQLLSASVLEGGVASVEGEFAWVDGDLSLSAGTYYMRACFIPAESDLYAVVEFYVEVVVNPAPQEITWELEVPVIVFLGDTVQLTAVATSGLEVSYSIDNEEIATLDGDKLIPLAVGDVTVIANQDGMEDEFQNYVPAEPVSYVFTIVKNEVETSLEQLLINPTKAYKQIRNGQMVIVCGEHVYNVLGGMIK